jgi:hypothetical protein
MDIFDCGEDKGADERAGNDGRTPAIGAVYPRQRPVESFQVPFGPMCGLHDL